MADVSLQGEPTVRPRRAPWHVRLVASRGFQRFAARVPGLRRISRNEGEAMFDLVAGFCHSQILMALVRLNIPQMLLEERLTVNELSARCAIPKDRMDVLVHAGQALGLLRKAHGQVILTVRGAALAGVPGLSGMIDHHDVLYRDLGDPVAFFRGDVATELADFWPYVFGAGAARDPSTAQRYSRLMTDSQVLVAEDTIALTRFDNVSRLMDVGGGAGAFLGAVGQAVPRLHLDLFDLPAVVPAARAQFASLGLADRTTLSPGSFRDDPLPQGADMISLVRVLYDHNDATVSTLLRKVFDALPMGGRLLISEPMTGGESPQRAGDAYFAIYCMAMRTGRARSPNEIAQLVTEAGFERVTPARSRRPFVTSVIEAVRPS